MPWLLLPLVPFLSSYIAPRVGGIQINLVYLFIPLAIRLGCKYRERGLIVLAFGGILITIFILALLLFFS